MPHLTEDVNVQHSMEKAVCASRIQMSSVNTANSSDVNVHRL